MERYIDLDNISDGRRYRENDLVKADCGGCKGCSSCCEGMEDTIVLDPYDVYQLCKGLALTFEELVQDQALELNLQDGLIQPNLKMTEEGKHCTFLKDGRCRIHGFRPGYCRLFPLGRVYENGDFSYFLQVHECPYSKKQKVKVHKWIGIPDGQKYRGYINSWHDLRMKLKEESQDLDEQNMKVLQMFFLRTFFSAPYDMEADFYLQYV